MNENDRVDDVNIETQDDRTGWALFTGSEGEDPTFVAFFQHRSMAESYIEACSKDSDAPWYLFEPCIAPAVVTADGILVANHYDLLLGAKALAKKAGLSDYHSKRLRQEAAPAPKAAT
jgi:hypothetical protein